MSEPRRFKNQLHERFGMIARALASPQRLEILDLLSQGPKSVEAIADQVGLSVKNTSAHLRALRHARLVETRKEGTFVFYRLASEKVFLVVRGIQELAGEQLPDTRAIAARFFEERDGVEPIGAAELLRRLESGSVTVLDVRPADEFEAGHISGAISVPLQELGASLASLPREREVVAYCRGPYCVYAAEAVELLRAHGFLARRAEDGVLDWKARGFPVEVGDAA